MTAVSDSPPSSYGAAVDLLGSVQKPGHGVPAYTRYVNRTWGRRLAALSYLVGLTPNQVTVTSGLVSLVGIVTLAIVEPGPVAALVVTSTLLFGYALDSADGQLARLRGGGSPAGEWLDHVVDAVRLPAMHIAVAVGIYRFGSDRLPEWYLLVPLGYLLVAVVRFFANMLTEQLLAARGRAVSCPVSSPRVARPPSRRSLARSLVLLPTDYGTLCIAFALLVSLPLFAWGYGALFAVNAAWLLLTLRRRYRAVAAPASGTGPGSVG